MRFIREVLPRWTSVVITALCGIGIVTSIQLTQSLIASTLGIVALSSIFWGSKNLKAIYTFEQNPGPRENIDPPEIPHQILFESLLSSFFITSTILILISYTIFSGILVGWW